MIPPFFNRKLLPRQPGIYIFRDQLGEPLYVGKAVDLYHRVSSYFLTSNLTSQTSRQTSHIPSGKAKTVALVEQIAQVETVTVESELEALILEANLIKKFLPPFNVRLTDDKDYLYIVITKGDFPQVVTARKRDLQGVKKYFGPFPSSTTVRQTLKMLRRVFPWCQYGDKQSLRADALQKSEVRSRRRACFYYHLGLCPGVCVGKISKEEYRKIINNFTKFLEGKKAEMVTELTKEMNRAAAQLAFEEAGRLKQVLGGIAYLTQPNRVSRYLENPNFLEDERAQALKQLQQDLTLSQLPKRIEAYDISNIGGKQATGSLVVLTDGEIDKSQYRRFKINISGKPNDVAMHQEMIRRRLTHPEWPLPQLILVDGGRGQVRIVYGELKAKNLNIPIYGLAKRMEWLYPPKGEIIKLPKRSLSLRLLQKIRNESHRFALAYHRKLRQYAFGIDEI